MKHTDETKLNLGIEELRLKTLESGSVFMIWDAEFAENGFIHEYPNGSMKLMQLSADERYPIEIRTLTLPEAAQIREKHGIPGVLYA
ncbi:hypothetical protein [Dyadobacter sp. Leaf189]|uniref:hypothetical protein n=1 Tax=Dyadobacter sp. Leaf189 TaxID=1736295 RepID=UPI00070031CF|nr:hypothetical protein [Dyadobacter sp. Leaf189]KQS30781.1 hypothetical protein ASG33_10395 [Dyadobacter sp. Leaf189]